MRKPGKGPVAENILPAVQTGTATETRKVGAQGGPPMSATGVYPTSAAAAAAANRDRRNGLKGIAGFGAEIGSKANPGLKKHRKSF